MGVVQMVNKKQGVFTTADEKAFQTFAVYCGLALHHAKVCEYQLTRIIALEVFSIRLNCS